MLLRNYYKHLAVVPLGGCASYRMTNGNNYTDSSASWSKNRFSFGSFGTVRTSLSGNSGVVFGTGGTTPTLDDYTLSGTIITTISATGTKTVTVDSEGGLLSGTYTITNTGTDEITIKEVAYLSVYNYDVLLDRTVLDEPVTIPAGGIGAVTYTIRMNYPTA